MSSDISPIGARSVERLRLAAGSISGVSPDLENASSLSPVHPASAPAADPGASSAPVTSPVAPPLTGPLTHPLLDGSGVGVLELLTTEDTVVQRSAPESTELEVGLERARTALLRRAPADALGALDEIWDGARRTEEGWYVRAGALVTLGLPGEGERVAAGGIEQRPSSSALRFVQTIARLAVGDVAGARDALAAALRRLPSDPLLLAQQAILHARGGEDERADAALATAARRVPAEHPALQYGREGVRAARSERLRGDSVAAEVGIGVVTDAAEIDAPRRAGGTSRDARGDLAATTVPSDWPIEHDVAAALPPRAGARTLGGDPLVRAIASLGESATALAKSDPDAFRAAVRALAQTLSSGGSLAGASTPIQSHAARTLLHHMLGALDGTPSPASLGSDPQETRLLATASATRAIVDSVLRAVRRGAPDDAARALSRAGSVTREPVLGLLHEFVRGALRGVQHAGPAVGVEQGAPMTADSSRHAPPTAAGESAEPRVEGGLDELSSGFVAVRLGLRLLDESRETRALLSLPARANRRSMDVFTRSGDGAPSPLDAADVSVTLSGTSTERSARTLTPANVAGGGALVPARTVGDGVRSVDARLLVPATREGATGDDAAGQSVAQSHAEAELETLAAGMPIRLVAIACIVLAAVAVAYGQTIAGVALGAGAAWLAVRRAAGGGTRRAGPPGDDAGR